jgi:hypothetical protein
MSRKIYVFTKKTYYGDRIAQGLIPWFKIGQTDQDDVLDRIKQQDKTSDAEPLVYITHYENLKTKDGKLLTDKMIHKRLTEIGKKKTRIDKNREWFELTIDDIENAINYLTGGGYIDKRPKMVLRPNQVESKNYIIDRFDKKVDILLFDKQRSGKTFITIDFLETMKDEIRNVILLTSIPSLNYQWLDTINKYKNNINVIILNDKTPNKHDPNKTNLYLISFQDAKDGNDDENYGLIKQKFNKIQNLNFELLIIDEVHIGKETYKTDKLLQKIKYDRVLGLTATGTKNLICGSFSIENTHTYDIKDENENKVKYPDIYGEIPNMNWLLYDISNNDILNESIKLCSNDSGFSFNEFFSINKINGVLKYANYIEKLFIDLLCNDNLTTPSLINKINVKNLLVLVPNNECMSHIRDILITHPKIKNDFDVAITNSVINNAKQLHKNIKNNFGSTKERSIIIANKQLTTGITLEKCDCVIFMNDTTSHDLYMQASFRSQTPYTEIINGMCFNKKRNCYVIDFKANRSIKMLNDFIYNQIKAKGSEITDVEFESYYNCLNIFNTNEKSFKKLTYHDFNNLHTDLLFNDTSSFSDLLDVKNIDAVLLEQVSNYFSLNKSYKVNKVNKNDKTKLPKSPKNKPSNNKQNVITKNQKVDVNAILALKLLLNKIPALSFLCKCKHNTIQDLLDGANIPFNFLGVNSILLDEFINTFNIDGDINNFKELLINIYLNTVKIDKLNVNLRSFNQKCNILMETNNIDDIIKIIERYTPISESEKKIYGEVYTPFSLINKMMDTLPPEVWSNPKLKFLDPCNGIGNFPSIIIKRLMYGLRSFEPNDKKRYKHIIENQIYVCDINVRNMFMFENIFNPNNEYKLNMYLGSYLDDDFDRHMVNEWKVDKFNNIVMNSPYQELKEGFKKSQPIWDKFVIKAVGQLVESGYLVAVHPDGWRSLGSGTFKNVNMLLKSKQISYLEMHTTADGKETFGANTTFDFYCLQNTEPINFTKIVCVDGSIENVDITQMEYIPNVNFDLFNKLVAKDSEERVNVLYNRTAYGTDKNNMSEIKTDIFKYPCVYTVGAKNPNFWHSNTNQKGHFGIPKVIWGNGLTDVIIDDEGKYGLTQYAYAIVDDPKNLHFIKRALKNPKFIKDVMGYTNGVGHIYNRKLISIFRKNFWEDFI